MCIFECLSTNFETVHTQLFATYDDATCRGWLGCFSNFCLIITARLFTARTLRTGFCFFGWWTVCGFILDRRRFSFLGLRRPRKYHSNHFGTLEIWDHLEIDFNVKWLSEFDKWGHTKLPAKDIHHDQALPCRTMLVIFLSPAEKMLSYWKDSKCAQVSFVMLRTFTLQWTRKKQT